MPKTTFQDMVKTVKKESHSKVNDLSFNKEVDKKNISSSTPRPQNEFASVRRSKEVDLGGYNPNQYNKYSMWFLALGCLVFLVFSLSFLFTKASVSLVPKMRSVHLDTDFSATRNAQNSLPFDIVLLSGEKSVSVLGKTEGEVSLSASGKVVLYNSFNSSPQPLAQSTRLLGSNGKTYQTLEAVTIPPMSKDGTPGSVSVRIIASSPGDASNSGPLDFNILGFKDTKKYEKFYGRSVGPIQGGFVGVTRSVSEEEKNQALEATKKELEKELFRKITEQTPKNFVFFDGAYTFSVDTENIDYEFDQGRANVIVKGTMQGFLFEEKKLEQTLISKILPEGENANVYVSDMRGLSFSFNPQPEPLADVESIGFNLKGDTSAIWVIDEEALAKDLLGEHKSDFKKILEKSTNIESAELVIRPMWKKTFPKKIEDIEILVKYPSSN